jgi:hypothetical protein
VRSFISFKAAAAAARLHLIKLEASTDCSRLVVYERPATKLLTNKNVFFFINKAKVWSLLRLHCVEEFNSFSPVSLKDNLLSVYGREILLSILLLAACLWGSEDLMTVGFLR